MRTSGSIKPRSRAVGQTLRSCSPARSRRRSAPTLVACSRSGRADHASSRSTRRFTCRRHAFSRLDAARRRALPAPSRHDRRRHRRCRHVEASSSASAPTSASAAGTARRARSRVRAPRRARAGCSRPARGGDPQGLRHASLARLQRRHAACRRSACSAATTSRPTVSSARRPGSSSSAGAPSSDATAAARRPARHAQAPTRRASRASRVKLVQRALRLTADGVFGPATRAAVRRLQQRHKMPATGVVGPKVWDRLGHERIRTVIQPDKRAAARTLVAGLIMARLPQRVRKVVAAASEIATAPYRLGGGHGNWNDSGYDCSGSVSYALWGGGLLSTALDSSGFMGWGAPGPGRWITVYANPSHAFMRIGAVRFDTSGKSRTGAAGSRTRSPPPATSRATRRACSASSRRARVYRPQQRLYLRPEPHGQGSLRPGSGSPPRTGRGVGERLAQRPQALRRRARPRPRYRTARRRRRPSG